MTQTLSAYLNQGPPGEISEHKVFLKNGTGLTVGKDGSVENPEFSFESDPDEGQLYV